ncbi:hypothetical protein KZ829_15010 [Actinoplanes hulinensis]|uniref:Uncharacterized protein n=1 Tax=Actinoplanes hulinensis TaxID=1144547 RepID=A0ABS7B247_9ACTN|nr:hypothetical protein [Actinoplanes hulinensis]MBW6435050.1 hypothetical protein [Actinoplanes hulinensis]
MTKRWMRSVLAAAGVLVLVLTPVAVRAQEAAGYDGYIRDGSCAEPGQDLHVDLAGGGSHDVEPYRAGDNVLGYYGAPQVPGFGIGAIYTGRRFSLVLTEAGRDVACGDLLRPEEDRFGRAGLAVAQLLPAGDGGVQGVAVLERTRLERELDIVPTRARILVSNGAVTPPAQPENGYNAHIKGGTCQAPSGPIRLNLQGEGTFDVTPYRAETGPGRSATLAYVGSPPVPGFALATAYTGQDFSLTISDPTGETTACGDVLRPDSDAFVEAGRALVLLTPTGSAGTPGYAVIQRVGMQRELDVTPTRVSIILFAAPAV